MGFITDGKMKEWKFEKSFFRPLLTYVKGLHIEIDTSDCLSVCLSVLFGKKLMNCSFESMYYYQLPMLSVHENMNLKLFLIKLEMRLSTSDISGSDPTS